MWATSGENHIIQNVIHRCLPWVFFGISQKSDVPHESERLAPDPCFSRLKKLIGDTVSVVTLGRTLQSVSPSLPGGLRFKRIERRVSASETVRTIWVAPQSAFSNRWTALPCQSKSCAATPVFGQRKTVTLRTPSAPMASDSETSSPFGTLVRRQRPFRSDPKNSFHAIAGSGTVTWARPSRRHRRKFS